MTHITNKEAKAIRALKRLAKDWPDGLWIFANGESLTVLRVGPGGERMTCGCGGMDPAYMLDEVEIPCDGGDW